MALELTIGRKDNELHELRQTLEEKTEQIVSLQDEGVKRAKELKVVKEKRDMGLKEIQKLRDKMEQIKAQNSLNESLNTSFSLSSLNDSVNLSNQEKGQICDLLQLYSLSDKTLHGPAGHLQRSRLHDAYRGLREEHVADQLGTTDQRHDKHGLR